jgi:hypothetical protein
LLGLLGSLGACAGTAKPTDAEYDDTAQAIASTTSTGSGGGEVGSIADVMLLAKGTPLPGFALSGSGAVSGSHLGLTYDYAISCKDASGDAMAQCTNITDEVDAQVAWSGELTLPTLMASIDRTGDWTLTGLQAPTTKLDGSGSIAFDATVISIFRPVTTTYHLDADAGYDALMIDTSTRLPVGGDIDYSVEASVMTTDHDTGDDASSKFSLDAVVGFAPDGTATLTLDGDHVYTLDTQTGVVVKLGR